VARQVVIKKFSRGVAQFKNLMLYPILGAKLSTFGVTKPQTDKTRANRIVLFSSGKAGVLYSSGKADTEHHGLCDRSQYTILN